MRTGTGTVLTACGSALLFAVGSGAARADAVGGPGGPGGSSGPGGPGPGAVVPASGTTVPVVEDGDMVMECDGVLHRFEVRGTALLRVGDRVAGPSPTVAVSTEAERLTGYDRDLGTVTVSAKGPAVGELAAPTATKAYPAAESLAQDVTVSMEHSPCRDGQPATYASKTTFPLLNTDLTAFPPRNAVYLLTDPVELVDVSKPSAPSFTLTSFPITVDQVR
ncbi:hypothetical protein GCM10009839_28510 [Catenulispora yoronensis]|uniref:Uncharacterized protein n=1 Tax=Catenulispora yoronensis TaxID=450799 RepID=A0ABP5FJ23_9ACTN